MKISNRLKKRALEFLVGAAFLLGLFWWHAWVVFLVAVAYFVGGYFWYRRETMLNFRISEPIRRGMNLKDVREIEEKYTMREDFNTFEKRAFVRSPLDRYFYYARYERVQRLLYTYAQGAKRVLDMGCGFGENTIYISQNLKYLTIGLELDRLKLKEARRRARKASLAKDIAFLTGDVSHPPFRASSFDCILLTEVLEHLIDPSEGLAACHYLLCYGGILVISTPSRHNLNYSLNPFLILEKALSLVSDRVLPPYHNLHAQFEFNWRNPEPEYGMHYHFSCQELEDLLQKTGFQSIWRGSFEIEIFMFLLIELLAQDNLDRINKYVAPIEAMMEKMPLVKHFGQHLLWVARKRS
jgi:2-polyprenyl-3-methyl-5-hydroxy-6-metoxy-1,4-benzoquinol methylase